MPKINTSTKSIIIVACIITLIIISGSITSRYFKSTAGILESSIQAAVLSVDKKDWGTAKKHLDTFESSWDKTKFAWAILLDHFEIDNIDNSFTKSKKYIESEDFPSALAELASLRHYILHIPRKEGFSLENIL